MGQKFNREPSTDESGPVTNTERAERGFNMSIKRLTANMERHRKLKGKSGKWDEIGKQWDMLVDATDKILPHSVVGGVLVTGAALTAGVSAPFAVAASVSLGGGMLLYNGIGRLGRWVAENRRDANYDKATNLKQKHNLD